MARRNREERVFVSFHYLKKKDDTPFTVDEFKDLCTKINDAPYVDVTDSKNVSLMRAGSLVPLTDYTKIDDLKAFGAFHATYTGHSYENNEKGTISARSINVRKFYYLLYLSKKGRIYVGAQYLGSFGGYADILYALKQLLPNKIPVDSVSIRSMSYEAQSVSPKELRLTIQRPPSSLGAKPSLVERGVVALQRSEKGSPFEDAVKSRILPILQLPFGQRKDALVKEIKEAGLFEFNDEEILNCSIVVDVGGRQDTIYIFDNAFHATKFLLDIDMTESGHPEPASLRSNMLSLLDSQVINLGKA